MSKWLHLLIAATFIASLAVVSCQSAPATPAASSPAKSEAPKAEAPKAEAPKAEAPKSEPAKAEAPKPAAAAPSGKVVIATTVDANSLDFMRMNTINPEFSLANHIFDALVWRDDNMKVHPQLAESWKMLDDRTWEFKLRKNVKFHDGEPFNAAAVKFTFDRAMDPATKSTDQVVKFIGLEGVEVVDDYTVRLITKAPAPAMLTRLSLFWIYPPKYYSQNSMDVVASKPVGSGPWKFVEWVKNDHITLEANTEYWKGAPPIKTLVFRPIPEVSTRIAELKSGGVDLIATVPPDQVKSIETATTRVEGVEGGRRIFVGFHITKGSPLEDKRVRQALNYAVDVDAITKALLGGYGQRRFTAVVPADVSPDIKPYPYDPAKAKQLLAEAGYPNGFEIVMDSPMGRYVKDKEVAQAVADYLTKVGVKTTVKPLDWATYAGQMLMAKKSDPLFLLGFSSFFDPVVDLAALEYNNALNPTEWNNAEFQSVFKQVQSTMDDKKRQGLLFKAQEIANDDPPWIWMYFQYDLYGVSKRLNWKPRADEFVLMHNAKLTQ
ncbi:MAG: ABC transporter substrate-binding protein [Chloroflexi bacterium]|nr:ABC transporter substrate-binding protein [Chloroflexota bacterium]